jgi:hypothetical protein
MVTVAKGPCCCTCDKYNRLVASFPQPASGTGSLFARYKNSSTQGDMFSIDYSSWQGTLSDLVDSDWNFPLKSGTQTVGTIEYKVIQIVAQGLQSAGTLTLTIDADGCQETAEVFCSWALVPGTYCAGDVP